MLRPPGLGLRGCRASIPVLRGGARIGGRKLDGDVPFNGEWIIRHDQIWYDDGEDSGFFNTDDVREDTGHTRDDYDFTVDPRHYDDDLMREAERNVQKDWDMDWRMGPNVWDWNNCQDYTRSVRDEYDRLERERNPTGAGPQPQGSNAGPVGGAQ